MSVVSDPTTVWDNSFARELPELALRWRAEAQPDPRLLILNEPLAAELGLDPVWLRSPDGVNLLVGAAAPPGATPVAQAYAGHQFGGFVPRLGDGRALLLGERVDATGHRRDVHLKGSGPTPFARGGDGRAVLGPMLREYLVSEAMHALGIPTTRALAVLSTGRRVPREIPRDGAVLVRVADSHLRVGSFQYAALQDRSAGTDGNTALVRRLADYAIARHYPAAADADHPYLALLDAVIAAQAALVARWMLVGFVHGVMNTDNMTISGETIDYGPCAFLDAYDPATVFSSIDHGGRYAYGNQPLVAQWNLARFAETVLPLLAHDEESALSAAVAAMEGFMPRYHGIWAAGMRAKFGLTEVDDVVGAGALIDNGMALLAEHRVDFTEFFRALARAGRGDAAALRALFADPAAFDEWLPRWRAMNPDPAGMDSVNPVYIPRNHLVEEALTAAEDGDLDPVQRLLDVLGAPFDERPGLERYAAGPPEGSDSYRTFCGT